MTEFDDLPLALGRTPKDIEQHDEGLRSARVAMLSILEARGLGAGAAAELLASIQDAGSWFMDDLAAGSVAYEATKAARKKAPGQRSDPRRRNSAERNAFCGAVLTHWRAAGLAVTGFDGRLGSPDDLLRFLQYACVWAGFAEPSPATTRVFVGRWKVK